MCIVAGGTTIPGGNPVTALPGLSPRSPPVMVVAPVLVTVEPARTLKFPAVSNGTHVDTGGGGGGGAHTGEVVNFHTLFVASVLPKLSATPVVTVAVKVVLGARGNVVGVKVAILFTVS